MGKFSASEYVSRSPISKMLSAGSQVVRCLNMELVPTPYDELQWNLKLLLEGPEIDDPAFEGMSIEFNNPAKGNYKGQAARVDAQQFPFSDHDYNGRQYYRDEDIFKWLVNFSDRIGKREELNKIPDTDDIKDFFADARGVLCDPDNYFWVTIAGQEYLDREDKPRTSLTLAKYDSKLKKGPVAKIVDGDMVNPPADLLPFNPDVHVTTRQKKEESVPGFGGQVDPPAPEPQKAAMGSSQPSRANVANNTPNPSLFGSSNNSAGDDDLPFKEFPEPQQPETKRVLLR